MVRICSEHSSLDDLSSTDDEDEESENESESDDDLEDVEEDTYIDDPAFFDTHKVWVDKVMAEEFVVSVCPCSPFHPVGQ